MVLRLPPLQGLGPCRFVRVVEIIQNGMGPPLFIHQPVQTVQDRCRWGGEEARKGGRTHRSLLLGNKTMPEMPGTQLSQITQLSGSAKQSPINADKRGCWGDTRTAKLPR